MSYEGLPLDITKGGTNATSASSARTNLGLGTMATQAANNVAITGGSITGITDLAVADGGTGASTLTGVLTGNGTSPITANAVTQNGVLVGGASNAVSSLGVATNGQLVIGSTGASPVIASMTNGNNIAWTGGAGTLRADFANISGTFTPTLVGATTNPTDVVYTSQVGEYYKIGKLVYVNVYMVVSSYTNGTGAIGIAGLPFTSDSTSSSVGWGGLSGAVLITGTNVYNRATYFIPTSNSIAYFFNTDNVTGFQNVWGTQVGFLFGGFYVASS